MDAETKTKTMPDAHSNSALVSGLTVDTPTAGGGQGTGRYPRMCKGKYGPHLIRGADEEVSLHRKCRECARARVRKENVSPAAFERRMRKKRKDNMTVEEVERRNARYRVANMTPEQAERKRALGRIVNMTAEQVERERARRRVSNMTRDQVAAARARKSLVGMTPEQAERARASSLRYYYSLSEDRYARRLHSNNVRRRRQADAADAAKMAALTGGN